MALNFKKTKYSLFLFRKRNKWFIWISIFISVVVQSITWSNKPLIKPSWSLLIVIYWSIPKYIGAFTSFNVGNILDIISGSTLGVRGLALSIITYLILFKINRFNECNILQQSLIISLFSFINNVIIFLLGNLSASTCFTSEIFYTSIIDGIIWPLFLQIMRILTSIYGI